MPAHIRRCTTRAERVRRNRPQPQSESNSTLAIFVLGLVKKRYGRGMRISILAVGTRGNGEPLGRSRSDEVWFDTAEGIVSIVG